MEDLLIRCAVKDGNYTVLEDQNLKPGQVRDMVRYSAGRTQLALEVVEGKSRCTVILTPGKAELLNAWLTAWLEEAKKLKPRLVIE